MPFQTERFPSGAREDAQRREMVEKFVAARGVDDPRVLAAMREVPRHRFVPEPLRGKAYGDHSLPIGHGQTISQPSVVGLMTQRLAVESGQKILEIGTGSGYQAAVLSRLARDVVTVERYRTLAEAARKRFEKLGYRNVTVVLGDGLAGVPAYAPYDRIIVTAAAASPMRQCCARSTKFRARNS